MSSKKRFLSKKKQKFSKNGLRCCIFCDQEIHAKRRRTFCSPECVHEYKLRTSSSYARYCVYKRDKGVCFKCGLNCSHLKKEANVIRIRDGKEAYKQFCASYKMPWRRKSFWDCHHLLPVSLNGGCCGLEGLMSLCYPCHKEETKRLMRYLSLHKQKNKKAISLPPSPLGNENFYRLFYTNQTKRSYKNRNNQ